MPRYNVEHNGKWACFSSISEGFITPFMEKQSYVEWLNRENKTIDNTNIVSNRTMNEAIFSIYLNRTKEETIDCLLESGLSKEDCENLFHKMEIKYYKPILIEYNKYKCPNCSNIIKKGQIECDNETCCLEFIWE